MKINEKNRVSRCLTGLGRVFRTSDFVYWSASPLMTGSLDYRLIAWTRADRT